MDRHYKLLLEYDQVPQSWWATVLGISFAIGLVCIYILETSLPAWGYIVSILIAALFVLFFGAQSAITGFGFNTSPVVAMIAGYFHPGKPLGKSYGPV